MWLMQNINVGFVAAAGEEEAGAGSEDAAEDAAGALEAAGAAAQPANRATTKEAINRNERTFFMLTLLLFFLYVGLV
jgi:hypothetical protein